MRNHIQGFLLKINGFHWSSTLAASMGFRRA